MISYIKGELVACEENRVIVENGGIGYSIFMPSKSVSCLPQTGNTVKIHTYLNVKEDAMQLYGFLTKDDLDVFRLVITVNGIGPKGGLAILSQLTPDELRFAVMEKDIKAISAAQGIGKKTAEKLIIELKDKLSIEDCLEKTADPEDVLSTGTEQGVRQDAVQALVALGYGSTDALRAVKNIEINEATTVEDVLKNALKYLL